LAPAGALQFLLVRRIAVAAWRLERADRMEVEVIGFRRRDDSNLGVAVMRDGNGPRSLEAIMRYRSATSAELMRSLRMLKALQAEARVRSAAEIETPAPATSRPAVVGSAAAPAPSDLLRARDGEPNKPEGERDPLASDRPGGRAHPSDAPLGHSSTRARTSLQQRPLPMLSGPAPNARPIEPETRRPEASAPVR
jgi:hypothetical protein